MVPVDADDRAAGPTPAAIYAAEVARREGLLGLADVRAQDGLGAELVLAAGAFVIRPALRDGESERARAERKRARSSPATTGSPTGGATR